MACPPLKASGPESWIFVGRYYSHPIVWKKVMGVLLLKKQRKEILNYGWRRKEFFNNDFILVCTCKYFQGAAQIL